MELLRAVGRAWLRRRFAWLFASLVLTLGAAPILDALGRDPNILETFLALNLVAAVVGAVAERGRRALLALGAVVLVAVAARATWGSGALLDAGEAAGSLVALLALGAILRTVLRSGSVDAERICAALSAYLLFGIVCAVIYWLFEQARPGSLVSGAGSAALTLRDAIYFSFVTLATLGYGDLVPASAPARSLAISEAIGGQLYLVVLVARLVTLYGARTGHEDCLGYAPAFQEIPS
jgi:hypothetical protein